MKKLLYILIALAFCLGSTLSAKGMSRSARTQQTANSSTQAKSGGGLFNIFKRKPKENNTSSQKRGFLGFGSKKEETAPASAEVSSGKAIAIDADGNMVEVDVPADMVEATAQPTEAAATTNADAAVVDPNLNRQPSQIESDLNSESPQGILNRIARQRQMIKDQEQKEGLDLFAQGLEFYRQMKFEEAMSYFRRAKRLIPTNPDLDRIIVNTGYVLGDGYEGAVDDAIIVSREKKIIEVQEQMLKVQNHMDQGAKLLETAKQHWSEGSKSKEDGKLDQAILALAKARMEYMNAEETARAVAIAHDVGEYRAAIKKAFDEIEVLRVNWDNHTKKLAERAARRQAEDLSRDQKAYEDAKLQRLLTQAKKDLADGFYQKSEELARRILREWPENSKARRILERARLRRDRKFDLWVTETDAEEWKRNNERIRRSSITYSEELTYPDYWDKIRNRQPTKLRKVTEPEWKKQLKRKMEVKVDLVLVDTALKDAIDILIEQTGINIVLDPGVDADDAVITSLRLEGVRFSSALQWLLDSVPDRSDEPLTWTLQDGAVYVTTRANLSLVNRPQQVLYDVTDLTTAFNDFALQDGEGLLIQGQSQTPGGTEGGEGQEALDSSSLQELIQANVDPASWDEEGIGITEFDVGKMLIAQTQENHKAIDELLEMFRRLQTLQVSVEARFINSQEDDLLDIGVDWRGLAQVPLEQLGDRASPPGSGVYSSRGNTARDTRVASILGNAGDVIGKGNNFVPGNVGDVGAIMQVSVLDPIRAALVLHAMKEKRKIKDILAPRLTVLNNHQGFVNRKVDTSYIADFNNEDGNIVPVIERISTGEVLIVRPTVSSDRKYITMDLSPQVIRNVEFRNLSLNINVDDDDGAFVGVIQTTLELPDLLQWQLQTRIQMPDGGVIFVGGRMTNFDQDATRGVPLLSKVPFFGRLFRADAEGDQLGNLLISIRSKILLFDEYEAKI